MFIYAVAISGMIVQWHYCSGDLESWQIDIENNSKSCCCVDDVADVHAADAADDCCSNTEVALAIEKDYSPFAYSFFDKQSLTFNAVLPTAYVYNLLDGVLQYHVALDAAISYNAPPIIGYDVPIYKQLSQFLLYDIV